MMMPGRQIVGGGYADRALRGVSIGGEPFIAFFQMSEGSGRLQQVLLRWDRRQPGRTASQSILAGLRERYGRERRVCREPKAGGGDLAVEHIWRFPTTTIHLTLLDFYTTAMAFEDPNAEPDPLVPHYKTQRNNPRFLPRSILVRFHASGRADLMGRCAAQPR